MSKQAYNLAADPSLEKYGYERGEGRVKHKWRHDRAGFEPGARGPIGKCHSSLTEDAACRLLHSGIVPLDLYTGEAPEWPPDQVFALYRGVPYVAVPTRPGLSYHGYPWRGPMPPGIEAALRERAEREGTSKEFERWLKTYGAR